MCKLFFILITASSCTLSPQEQIQLLEIENLSLKTDYQSEIDSLLEMEIY